MMAEENPKYKINHVRVYQNPDMDEQKVGCSTPERPTRQYIEAHEKLYKTEHDVSIILSKVCVKIELGISRLHFFSGHRSVH
jgi:hypothetical protein